VNEHPATDLIVTWWAERFQVADKREAFKAALRQLFCEEWLLETPRVRLAVDYDPQGALFDAVIAAGVPCRGYMFSATGILPTKTWMRIALDDIEVREGYGAPFETIWKAPEQ
jgi:hypothetical protein